MRDRQKKVMGIAVLSAMVAAVVTACGGSDGPVVAPQLSAAQAAAFVGDCADLTAKISALPNTGISAVNKIVAGTVKVGGVDVPEHCQVTGKMNQRTGIDGASYAIGFEIRLPKSWNGRFYHQGNGGTDATVATALGGLGGGPVTGALFQGFAVLISDAGHSGGAPDFGVDPQARLDYGYQAVGKLTPMAKSVITSAYGKAPDRSYFGGCSNGGRHAMATASRYPKTTTTAFWQARRATTCPRRRLPTWQAPGFMPVWQRPIPLSQRRTWPLASPTPSASCWRPRCWPNAMHWTAARTAWCRTLPPVRRRST